MEYAENAEHEETLLKMQFVMLDFSPLKLSIMQHCHMWQTKFTQLLGGLASSNLTGLYAYMDDNVKRCRLQEEELI